MHFAHTYGSDLFTRANSAVTLGNAESGATWTPGNAGDVAPDAWGISGNKAYMAASPATGTDPHVWIETDQADGVITCDVSPASAASSGQEGLLFRRQNATNYYAVRLNNAADTVGILRNLAGSRSTVTSTALVIADGQTIVVRIVLSGSSVTVFCDGVLKLTYVDASFAAATKHGMYATENLGRFDNFQVTNG